MGELRKIISESAPLLEAALRDVETPKYAIDLQLRGSVCGLATAALQLYVRNRHDVLLDRRIASPESAPRGINSRKLQHVALFDGSAMIDPSYSQFYAYVGLSREAAHEQPSLSRLYPDERIAIIQRGMTRAFADDVAAHMNRVEPEITRQRSARYRSYPPEDSFVGMSLEEKKAALRDIWSPAGYKPFPIGSQSDSFYRRVLQLVGRMHELEK